MRQDRKCSQSFFPSRYRFLAGSLRRDSGASRLCYRVKVFVGCFVVVVFVDPNTKRFKQTLISFDTATQYANIWGSPFYQATKRHLNNR